MSEIPEKVEQTIEKIVAAEGFELVHLEFRKQGRQYVLRIDVDKEGGITLDECVLVSQQVSTWLDVEDPFPSGYELEVGSPGLDRKFYRESDYQKFIGRLVRVKTSAPIRGLHVIVGHLKSFDGEKIVVSDPKNTKKDPNYEIPLKDIKETRLEVEI
jgi:ribosome maturation factor RimP